MPNNQVTIINPVTENQDPIVYNSFIIQNITINLGISADISVLLKKDDNIVTIKIFTMSGNDYDSWGNNDSYVTNWVAQQLGSYVISTPVIN